MKTGAVRNFLMTASAGYIFVMGLIVHSVYYDTYLVKDINKNKRLVKDTFNISIADLEQQGKVIASGRAEDRARSWEKLLDSLKLDKATKESFMQGYEQGVKKSFENSKKIMDSIKAIRR